MAQELENVQTSRKKERKPGKVKRERLTQKAIAAMFVNMVENGLILKLPEADPL